VETVIVIDVLGAHDRVQSRHRIERAGDAASCTIGRGAAADVTLEGRRIVVADDEALDVDALDPFSIRR